MRYRPFSGASPRSWFPVFLIQTDQLGGVIDRDALISLMSTWGTAVSVRMRQILPRNQEAPFVLGGEEGPMRLWVVILVGALAVPLVLRVSVAHGHVT